MGGSFSASALMWPSLERKISTEEEMCFASKQAASGAEVHFQQRAGGIHTSWVFFTETYEGSLSGSHTHTHSRLIVLTAGKHCCRRLCVRSRSAEASGWPRHVP